MVFVVLFYLTSIPIPSLKRNVTVPKFPMYQKKLNFAVLKKYQERALHLP